MSDHARLLAAAIAARTARIGIVGLGYVGLPLTRLFHDAGFHVLGFDVDPHKLATLAAGRSYLRHLGPDFVEAMLPTGRFEATCDPRRLAEPDVLLVCVPTPLDERGEPDLGAIVATCDALADALRPGQLICLESTSWPRTTREVLLPRLEASPRALRCGREYFLAFAPEREDPGRQDLPARAIPKLVGGIDETSARLAEALYATVVDRVVRLSSAEAAEAAKLLENVFRAVNIALANEMKVVLSAFDLDIWEVIDAAATKPFGFMPFYPGLGAGGHCIPVDPVYLTWKARTLGVEAPVIELAAQRNRAMPAWVVERTAQALAERGRALADARVLVLGIAYKPNVDDLRESPALELIALLRASGAQVAYHDPHVPSIPAVRRHALELHSLPLDPATLADCDAVLIATAHQAVDWQLVADHAPLVVDTRNALRDVRGPRHHIVRA